MVEEEKKCECGMPLDDKTECACSKESEQPVCIHCCECADGCECDCKKKVKEEISVAE